jgi:hypothetical protein
LYVAQTFRSAILQTVVCKETPQMARMSGLASVLCLTLLAGCAREQGGGAMPGGGGSPRDVPIFIHLVETGGNCVVVAGKEPVRVHKRDKVVWEVLNDCTADRKVTFHKFKRNGNDDDPTDVNKKDVSPRSNGRDKLRVGIRNISASGVRKYKYNILLDSGFELDPELEVEY